MIKKKVQLIPVEHRVQKLLPGEIMWKPYDNSLYQLDEEHVKWILDAINNEHQVLATTLVEFYLVSDDEIGPNDQCIQIYRQLINASQIEENRERHAEMVKLLGANEYWVKKVVATPEQIGYYYSPISSSATEAGVGTSVINVDQLQTILQSGGHCYIDWEDNSGMAFGYVGPKLYGNKSGNKYTQQGGKVLISENEKDFENE